MLKVFSKLLVMGCIFSCSGLLATSIPVQNIFTTAKSESDARTLKRELIRVFEFLEKSKSAHDSRVLHASLSELLVGLQHHNTTWNVKSGIRAIKDALASEERKRIEQLKQEKRKPYGIQPPAYNPSFVPAAVVAQTPPPSYNPFYTFPAAPVATVSSAECTLCDSLVTNKKEKFFRCPDSENKHYLCKGCFVSHAKAQKELKNSSFKDLTPEELKCPYCRESVNMWGEEVLKDHCGKHFFDKIWSQ